VAVVICLLADLVEAAQEVNGLEQLLLQVPQIRVAVAVEKQLAIMVDQVECLVVQE
jgi:hypothetical protein